MDIWSYQGLDLKFLALSQKIISLVTVDAAFWPYLIGSIHRQGNGRYSPELPNICLLVIAVGDV